MENLREFIDALFTSETSLQKREKGMRFLVPSKDNDWKRLSKCDGDAATMFYNKYIDKKKTLYRGHLAKEPDVVDDFKRIIKNRPKPKIEPIVDGYSAFLFLDSKDRPKVALHWEKYFQLSVKKYNSIYRVQLPKITPHVCRHTFCTNMAKSGMNPKVLQYIMGHGDISVTLDTYTHIKAEDAIAEMEGLDLLTEKEA